MSERLQPQRLRTAAERADAYLTEARRIATAQFGADRVEEIPLLVVQTAQLMAALAAGTSEDK